MLTKVTVERALNAELGDLLVTINMKYLAPPIAVMAPQAKPFALKMASSSSIHREIEMGAFSLSWLRKIKLASPP